MFRAHSHNVQLIQCLKAILYGGKTANLFSPLIIRFRTENFWEALNTSSSHRLRWCLKWGRAEIIFIPEQAQIKTLILELFHANKWRGSVQTRALQRKTFQISVYSARRVNITSTSSTWINLPKSISTNEMNGTTIDFRAARTSPNIFALHETVWRH